MPIGDDNLARVHDSLPNGYCGRPPQQECPHPNACLTCPDFQTTPEFLDIHRRQAHSNRRLMAQGQRRRTVPTRRQPPPRAGQPRPDHPRARSPRGRQAVVTRADNTHHLQRAATARHDAALQRGRGAIEDLDRAGQPITFTAVARAARVSRGWLYNQPDLRDAIIRLRRERRSCRRAHDAGRTTRVHRITPPAPRLGTRRDHPPARRQRRAAQTARTISRRTAPPTLTDASMTCPQHTAAGQPPLLQTRWR